MRPEGMGIVNRRVSCTVCAYSVSFFHSLCDTDVESDSVFGYIDEISASGGILGIILSLSKVSAIFEMFSWTKPN